ncbi:unnamed protein product, partial [Adineta ricciae]
MSIAAANDTETNDTKVCKNEVEPTQSELATLEHVSDRFPFTTWLLIFGQLCEQFVYFGTYIVFQNYIQFPIPTNGEKQAGALGYGRKMATAVTMSYSCLCNLSPIAAAIIADQFWGRYKTLTVASFIYFFGLIILVLTSIPALTKIGVGFPGLICALIVIGLAVGAFKSIMGPFMAEQYSRKAPVIKVVKGQRKILSPEMTIQSLFNWFYWAANFGAFIAELITPTVEKYHSFWLAYFLASAIFPCCIIVLFVGRRRFTRQSPTGSLVVRAFRVTWNALANRWKLGKQSANEHLLDYAKGRHVSNDTKRTTEQTKNEFIDDLKQTFHACRVFVFFPLFWMCFNQEVTNLTSQAAQMNVGPLPNDLLQTINPLVVVVFVPIFDKIVYPMLRKCHIKFGPIERITWGFIVTALGMAWIAIVQHLIYSTAPNFDYTVQPCSTCQKFNNITVAWQIPARFLIGIGEIFAVISGIEYAYVKAPTSMKSIVMALFVCARAVGSLLNV